MRSQIVSLDDDEDDGYAPQSSRPGRVIAPFSEDEDEDFIPVSKHAPAPIPKRRWNEPESPQYDDDIEVSSVVDVEMDRKPAAPPGIPTEPLPALAQAIPQFKQRVGAKRQELDAREEQAEAERVEMDRLRIELMGVKGELEAARQRVRTLETAVYEQEILGPG